MLEMFEKPYIYNTGLVLPPNWFYLKRRYRESIASLINYYRTRAYNVKSNHFLVNILYHLTPPLDYDDFRYVELCRARADYVARAFEMSTPTAYGKSHHGVFYSKNDDEVLILDEERFNVSLAAARWRNLSPVRILKSSTSNLDLLLLKGNNTPEETGLNVLTINITLLSFMYKCFVRSKESEDVSYARFVHTYILPNMLYNILDHCIVNRTMNLFYGRPNVKTNIRHAITFPHLEEDVDKALRYNLEEIKKKTLNYEMILKSMCCLVRSDAQKLLLVGEYIPTRQQDWAYYISRLEIIKFLIDIGGYKGIRANRDILTNLSYHLKYLTINDKSNHIRDMKESTNSILSNYVKDILTSVK